MMGRKARVTTPRHSVSLEDLVPADHFYRHLDRVLDLAFVRDLVRHTSAPAGRPSIDPMVFFRLQLVLFVHDGPCSTAARELLFAEPGYDGAGPRARLDGSGRSY